MKRICVWVVLSVLLCIPFHSLADDRRADKTQLKIMTLNAEWMWDGVKPHDGDSNNKPSRTFSPKKSKKHMARVAQIIKSADADIVMLQEVEDLQSLKKLNKKFLSDMGYKAFLVDGKDTWLGQDVALLSRIDPISVERNDVKGRSGKESKGVSEHLIAKMDVGGEKLAFIGVHLLAYPLKQSRVHKRQAQSDAVRKMAVKLAKDGFQPIILGDFNDYDPEVLDHVGHKPITLVLLRAKSMELNNDKDDLVNALAKAPVEERYTIWFDRNKDGKRGDVEAPIDENEHAAIDHVLMPKKLFEKIKGVRILHDHDPQLGPDHLPVVVVLQ